jgi:hypothetical protein
MVLRPEEGEKSGNKGKEGKNGSILLWWPNEESVGRYRYGGYDIEKVTER